MSIITAYVTISWVVFGLVALWAIVTDQLQRRRLFGYAPDKFGTTLGPILWSLTVLFILSTAPWVNLVWVPMIIFAFMNRNK